MNREEALKILKENVLNQNLLKHSYAVEAVMRKLAFHFGEDEEKWALAGLLHDIDYEKTKTKPEEHSLIGAQMLEEIGLDTEICQAVRTHNEMHGMAPETKIAKALFVSDPLTGLIVAATLVLPSKRIGDLSPGNILNRFGEKAFARGANRKIISKCQDLLGLDLEEFIKIGLEAMQGIGKDLGL